MKINFEETKEIRSPQAGEWFRGYNGTPKQAMFDFSVQEFPILKVVIEEENLSK